MVTALPRRMGAGDGKRAEGFLHGSARLLLIFSVDSIRKHASTDPRTGFTGNGVQMNKKQGSPGRFCLTNALPRACRFPDVSFADDGEISFRNELRWRNHLKLPDAPRVRRTLMSSSHLHGRRCTMHRRREGRLKPTFIILMNHSDFAPPLGRPGLR